METVSVLNRVLNYNLSAKIILNCTQIIKKNLFSCSSQTLIAFLIEYFLKMGSPGFKIHQFHICNELFSFLAKTKKTTLRGYSTFF